MTFGAFFSRQSVTPSAPLSVSVEVADRKQRCQRTGFIFGEAQGHGGVCLGNSDWWWVSGKSDGQLQSFPPQPAGPPGINVTCHVLRGKLSVSCRSGRRTDGARVQPRDMKETGKVAAAPLPPTPPTYPHPSLGGPWRGWRGRGSVAAWQLGGCPRADRQGAGGPHRRASMAPSVIERHDAARYERKQLAARTRSDRFQPVFLDWERLEGFPPLINRWASVVWLWGCKSRRRPG